MQYVSSQPQQGVLYQRLQAIIASGYSGLGPQNVGQHVYSPMIGQAFQKPTSGTAAPATVSVQKYR